MKTFETTSWGRKKTIRLVRKYYRANNNLCIQAEAWDEEYEWWEPWCPVTINLGDSLDESHVYLDVNNCDREIINYCLNNSLIAFDEPLKTSGFVMYSLVRVTDKMNDYLLD